MILEVLPGQEEEMRGMFGEVFVHNFMYHVEGRVVELRQELEDEQEEE
jgi:hypothetical protein